MRIHCSGKNNITLGIFVTMLTLSPLTLGDQNNTLIDTLTSSPLNLSLPAVYVTPPAIQRQTNLNLSQNIYHGSLDGLKTNRVYPYGYRQVTLDKSMRMRGWKLKDNLHLGQTRVGKKWGLGVMMTQGDFAYGLNNKGAGMIYKSENSIYRVNTQEISLGINF
jgi:hypothetical protein